MKSICAPEIGIIEFTKQITLLSLISLLFYLSISLSLSIFLFCRFRAYFFCNHLHRHLAFISMGNSHQRKKKIKNTSKRHKQEQGPRLFSDFGRIANGLFHLYTFLGLLLFGNFVFLFSDTTLQFLRSSLF